MPDYDTRDLEAREEALRGYSVQHDGVSWRVLHDGVVIESESHPTFETASAAAKRWRLEEAGDSLLSDVFALAEHELGELRTVVIDATGERGQARYRAAALGGYRTIDRLAALERGPLTGAEPDDLTGLTIEHLCGIDQWADG